MTLPLIYDVSHKNLADIYFTIFNVNEVKIKGFSLTKKMENLLLEN